MTEKLPTITCEEIMTTPLEPIAFCIENLMAQGLYVFAGALNPSAEHQPR